MFKFVENFFYLIDKEVIVNFVKMLEYNKKLRLAVFWQFEKKNTSVLLRKQIFDQNFTFFVYFCKKYYKRAENLGLAVCGSIWWEKLLYVFQIVENSTFLI